MNQSGFIRCEASRVGEDTTLSQIIKMVSDAAATKAPIAKVADRVSGVFVPAVIAIAVLTVIGWLAAGETYGFALARGISVLVISCPCALGASLSRRSLPLRSLRSLAGWRPGRPMDLPWPGGSRCW